MKENIFTILGSCVTRDIFNFSDEMKVRKYYPRTSLQSLMGEKFTVNYEDIELESDYQKLCIKMDFESEFLKESFIHNEYIILDFIDERFNVLKLDSKIIGTASNEYKNSKLGDKIYGINMVKNEYEDWCKSFDKLLKHFESKNIIANVILHECYYKKNYISKDEKITLFSDRIKFIEQENHKLSQKYKYVKSKIKNIKIIGDKNNIFYANEKHRWGLAPYHYEDQYYINMSQQLKEILNLH